MVDDLAFNRILIKMKILVLACILGLGVSFCSYWNTASLFAGSKPCFSEDRSYPDGSTIYIGQNQYRCSNGRWVRI